MKNSSYLQKIMIEWARGRLRRVDVSCVFVRIALSGTRLVCVLNESARD